MIRRLWRELDICADIHYRWFAWALIATGVLLRCITLSVFPHYLGEDSDGYLSAMDFLRSGNPEGRIAYGYRQVSYPLILAWLFDHVKYPIYTLAFIQACATSFVSYFFYHIANWLRLDRLLTLFSLTFLTFYGRFLLYSVTIAPEALIVCGIAFALFLMTFILDDVGSARKSKLMLFVYIVLGLDLIFICSLKEVLLPFAGLAMLAMPTVALAKSRGPRAAPRLWARMLIVPIIFASIYLAGATFARNKLQVDRLRTTCFPWPLPVACYYLNLEKPTHTALKRKIGRIVAENNRLLENWDFAYERGNEKVNAYCFEGEAGHEIVTYSERAAGLTTAYGYEAMCAVEKYGGALFKEGVQAHFRHYLQYWMYPEIYRGLFSSGHIQFGEEFRSVTENFVTTMQGLLAVEFANREIYRYLKISNDLLSWSDIKILSWLGGTGINYLWLVGLVATVLVFVNHWKRTAWSTVVCLLRSAVYLAVLSWLTPFIWYYLPFFIAYLRGGTRQETLYWPAFVELFPIKYWREFATWFGGLPFPDGGVLERFLEFTFGDAQIRHDQLKSYFESLLFFDYGVFSWTIIYGIFAFIGLSAWRVWRIEQRVFVAIVAGQLAGYLIIVSSISWFYERYTNYIFLSVVLLATCVVSATASRIVQLTRWFLIFYRRQVRG